MAHAHWKANLDLNHQRSTPSGLGGSPVPVGSLSPMWRTSPSTPTAPPPRLRIPSRASANFNSCVPRTPSPTQSLPTPALHHTDVLLWGHESGSANYLGRIIRIACRQSATPAPDSPCAKRGDPSSTMDFLASFGLGGNEAAPVEDDKYESVEALALHLRGLLEDKTTPTKAEHVATVLEMRSTAQFHVSLSNTENEAFAKSTGTDPTMGGGSSSSTSVDPAGQTVRTISANDTLRNQSDNPFLQRTIAKHIVDVLGATDHSQWILRDLSRGQHGWSFTYICKDSLQQWTRENPKSKSSAVIGEYSQKDPDDILASTVLHCVGSYLMLTRTQIVRHSTVADQLLSHSTETSAQSLSSTIILSSTKPSSSSATSTSRRLGNPAWGGSDSRSSRTSRKLPKRPKASIKRVVSAKAVARILPIGRGLRVKVEETANGLLSARRSLERRSQTATCRMGLRCLRECLAQN